MKKNSTKKLTIVERQIAIDLIKEKFRHNLAKKLNLVRVSAPLFVTKSSGLNDGLNGEKPISFFNKMIDDELEIVHSLAKWKRNALSRYDIGSYDGIYTDMNAIRKEETLDATHSIYVDQWDWELKIDSSQRNTVFLEKIVNKIYQALYKTSLYIQRKYRIPNKLVKKIHFIDSLDLYNMFPNLTPEQREYEIVKQYKSVFITKIGYPLPDLKPHSNRSKDYDDWNLNGDLIVYDETNDSALELSSMGIRVDKNALIQQYNKDIDLIKLISKYHKDILEDKLPLTIGGGIGQSRLAMFLLHSKHIGEVQASIWDEETIKKAKKNNTILL
ncbi:Aspartate--ammonia ligase [Metamycoplasma cloacale]|uniref:Aspartate--ammonia ligase n=1 Tax=Metamycoplasma cloacale TaxID=92401 RepID=A0A2Z4LMJ3_9BACT|nr:aspartate--ammonia ligase [Metamycoplasma cloacale]AWX42940.1 aspartate--ammonia ligase [Metamycoplasma cloacale]VEU79236.1 Aspartate--ammonia ligase [Metamycoplasma cloacale]